ncbi:MAG: hypothetical protein J5I92_15340 [Thiogranum sp.]|nr:hypothetical protein [Thiogranum sp.]
MLSKRPIPSLVKGRKKVALPAATPAAPAAAPSAARASSLAAELSEALEKYDLTIEELAELLSAHSGEHISRTGLGGWLRGSTPRIGDAPIRKALAVIAKDENWTAKPRWAAPQVVQRKIKAWLRTMTHRQIQIAGELPQSTYQAMFAGKVRVEYRRWLRICSLVDMWRKAAAAAGVIEETHGRKA